MDVKDERRKSQQRPSHQQRHWNIVYIPLVVLHLWVFRASESEVDEAALQWMILRR